MMESFKRRAQHQKYLSIKKIIRPSGFTHGRKAARQLILQ